MGVRNSQVYDLATLIDDIRRRQQSLDVRVTRIIDYLKTLGLDDIRRRLSALEAIHPHVPAVQNITTTIEGDTIIQGGDFPWVIVASVEAPQSIKDAALAFGFVCDGVNDEVEILAAVNILMAQGGGTIYMSEGNFFCDAVLVMPALGATSFKIDMVGQGQRASVIQGQAGAGLPWVMDFTTGSLNFRDITVTNKNTNAGNHCIYTGQSNLAGFNATRTTLTASASDGVGLIAIGSDAAGWSGSADNSIIDGMTLSTYAGRLDVCRIIKNVRIQKYLGTTNSTQDGPIISGCEFNGTLWVGDGTQQIGRDNLVITGCVFTTSAGVNLQGGLVNLGRVRNGLVFTSNYMQASTPTDKFTVNGSWANIVVTGNVFEYAHMDFDIDTSTHEPGNGVTISNNVWSFPPHVTTKVLTGVPVDIRGVRNLLFSGNRVWGRHMIFEQCFGGHVDGNLLEGPQVVAGAPQGGINLIDCDDMSVTSNRFVHDGFASGADACVLVDATTVNTFVDGNVYMSDYGGVSQYDYGIIVQAGASDTRIGTNDWTKAAVGLLSDAGTNTRHWLAGRALPVPAGGDNNKAITYDSGTNSWKYV